jgi:two-component system, sensor histidine kinase
MAEMTGLTTVAGAAARAQGPLRVLLADDDRDATISLAMLLRLESYAVQHVYDGGATLDAVREFDPDIVLIDIGMPTLSGYEVARRIRDRYGKERPVLVALTGWKQASDRILATLAGFNHHIAKPYDPGELLALIRRLDPAQSSDTMPR